MVQRVFVHVGLPKSGTTYIQAVLGANKARLGEHAAVLYPGRTWSVQVDAVRDLLDVNPHGVSHSQTEGAWARLVREIKAWDGDAVISMEWLCAAGSTRARRLVESLAPAQVELVVTVRDLGRTIPAAWQEFMRNWETDTWSDFLRAISGDDPLSTSIGSLFWSQQDVGRVLANWRDAVADDHIHVVTLPHPGQAASELWLRFASVLGVEPGRYDASGRSGNESVGLASSELLRRFNALSRQQQLGWPVYADVVKEGLAKRGLAPRRPREPNLAIPSSLNGWVHDQAKRQRTTIEESGVRVIGDLDELSPVLGDGIQPDHLEEVELVLAALDGLLYLARKAHQQGVRVRELNQQVRSLRSRIEELETDIERRRTRPVRQAAIDATEQHPRLMSLRRVYWRLADLIRGRR